MRRFFKILAWIVAALIAVPVLLLVVVLAGANIDPGRRMIETLTPRLTGGMVRLDGLAGRFPDAIRLRRLTVADQTGVWVTVDDAALDWSPRTLLEGKVSIDRLDAGHVGVARLPAATSGTSSESGSSSFPVPRIVLSRLRVERLEIDAPVTGRQMDLTVDGSGDLLSLDTGAVHLAVTPLASATPDHPSEDRYTADVSMDPSHLHATLDVSEAAKGLIATIAQLPDLGAVTIRAVVDGPLGALATRAAIEAGPLRANLDGTVDLLKNGADLAFVVTSPAMAPAPGIAWDSIRLEGKMHGPFVSPAATGTLAADGLTAAGAAIGSLRANLAGDASGKAELHAQLDNLRIPGPSPDLLAGGPLTLDAAGQLGDAKPSVQFTLKHTLLSAEGTGGLDQAHIRLTIPDLKPFAAIGGVDLQGQTDLNINVAQSKDVIDVLVKGGVGITGGMSPVPALIGNAGTIDLAATLHGGDVRLNRFAIGGSAIKATTSGQFVDRRLDADWTLSLSDLGVIRPGASGTITGHGHVSGPQTSLSVTADITGDVAAEGGRLDQFSAHADLDGLPGAPSARLTAGGTVMGSPLAVSVAAEQRDGGFHVVIDRTAWKSLTADGTLDLAGGAALPTGKVTLTMSRLADLAPIIGQPIAGSINASLDASAAGTRISAVVAGAGLPNTAMVGKADLEATVTDPAGNPAVDGTLTLDGVEASGTRASGRLAAKGPLDAVALTIAAQTGELHGQPARVETSGTLNVTDRNLLLASLQASWGKEALKLLAPARIGFAQGVTVDRLRVGFHQGELTVAGNWGTGRTPSGSGGGDIAVTANLTNLPADVIAIFAPAYAADGMIAADARLTGSAAHPQGSVHLTASALRLRTGPGRALPSANLVAGVTLDGSNARVDTKFTAGRSDVTLTGLAPMGLAGRMDLRLGGAVDLALLNPLLTAQGRQVKGSVELALGVSGTPSAPIANGTVRLANGDVQDATLGVHLSTIAAVVQADGDTIRLERLDAKAGLGTISGGGSVRMAQGFAGPPVIDLTIRASNAKVLATDLITALIDANLTIRGDANGAIALGGTLLSRETDIRVPEKLPPGIAVIPVRNAGAAPVPPPPPATTPEIALNLTLDAPDQVYIRGRGLDVELGGKVVFGGTAARPLPQGGLQLRRGTFSLAGQALNLTEGTIDFTGGGLTNPSLKLVASSSSATQTSTLTISGDVRNPKITLSSVPDLPQDEILSQLLFNTAKSRLSPFQLAEIAAALASISGVGGVGDPLEGLRSALGLDQLSVGSGAGGAATLQAGRYVAKGVRVGASQSATGGQTQATVQIDLAKGLKLETSVATSSSATAATPGTSNGTTVGVTYQFEY